MQLLTESALLQQWRRQVAMGRYVRMRQGSSIRPLASLGFLVKGGTVKRLVELPNLSLVVLHDEDIGREKPAIRLVVYGASRIEHGVQWGGPENIRAYKDFGLLPGLDRNRLRVSLENTDFLELTLTLERRIRVVARYHQKPVRRLPVLPPLWAGFFPGVGSQLRGEGPEIEERCSRFGMSPERLMQIFERQHYGLALYPLEWVSGQLDRCVAIFADLDEVPKQQVFRVQTLSDDLVGYQGAGVFDFYHSHFRERYAERLRSAVDRRDVLVDSPADGSPEGSMASHSEGGICAA